MLMPITEEIFVYEKLDFKCWVTEKINHCKKFFNENQHLPYMVHYFLRNKDLDIEEHIVDLTDFLNHKDLMAELIPAILKQQKAFAYFTCCEAWMKAFNKGEFPPDGKQVSDYEDKDEVLMFNFQNVDLTIPLDNLTEAWKIIRDKVTGKGTCTERLKLDSDYQSGRLTNYLDKIQTEKNRFEN